MKQLNISKIEKIIEENSDVKTIHFKFLETIEPGQFFMIWIPGIDEIPMSVSVINDKIKGITFRRVGDATDALFKIKEGDLIGVRGPFGNGFKFTKKKILIIGGGTGIAMVAPAVEKCIKEKYDVEVILGAKTKNELFFKHRMKKTGAKVHISTDDGSEGFKGFASDLAKKIVNNETNFDLILTCGPELMMKSLYDYCNEKNISFQASLERYMKCAVGICGQCCVGDGLRVCVEGPVFPSYKLDKIKDFGRFKRDASGKKIRF